jgi:hypothetical protein
MLTSTICVEKFGEPTPDMERKYMKLYYVPALIRTCISVLPNRIYMHKLLEQPLENAFKLIIKRKLEEEVKSWDGCFIVRKIRGGTSMSIHSWGLAIDINAATNGLGREPQMSKELVKCFTDAGFDWGGTWKRKDGMHFQLSLKLIK